MDLYTVYSVAYKIVNCVLYFSPRNGDLGWKPRRFYLMVHRLLNYQRFLVFIRTYFYKSLQL